jgi:hypothetical protein
MLLDRLLELGGHDIQRLVPGDLNKLIALAKQRGLITVTAIKNFGKAVAFDAEEPTIHGDLRIALDGDHLSFSKTHQDAASGATETAGALFPCVRLRLCSLRVTYGGWEERVR